jgi:hypothetical protein
MPVIDATTAIGKIRLRTGDWSDLSILPDSVIQSALDDCNNSLPRAAALCAQYILGTLTSSVHKKMFSMEIWGKERFDNYLKFIQTTILNPNLAQLAPIPYGRSDEVPDEITQFISDWKQNYYNGTESQALAMSALYSHNDGSTYGRGY